MSFVEKNINGSKLKEAFEKMLDTGFLKANGIVVSPEVSVKGSNIYVKCQAAPEDEREFWMVEMQDEYLYQVAKYLNEVGILTNDPDRKGRRHIENELRKMLTSLSGVPRPDTEHISDNCVIRRSYSEGSEIRDIATLEFRIESTQQLAIERLEKATRLLLNEDLAFTKVMEEKLEDRKNWINIDNKFNAAPSAYGNENDMRIVKKYLEDFVEKNGGSSVSVNKENTKLGDFLEANPALKGTPLETEHPESAKSGFKVSFTVSTPNFDYGKVRELLSKTFNGIDSVKPIQMAEEELGIGATLDICAW